MRITRITLRPRITIAADGDVDRVSESSSARTRAASSPTPCGPDHRRAGDRARGGAGQAALVSARRRRFLLLHGWQNRRPEGHWQFWLAERLRARGEQVLYPQLPRPDEPRLEEWIEVLRRRAGATRRRRTRGDLPLAVLPLVGTCRSTSRRPRARRPAALGRATRSVGVRRRDRELPTDGLSADAICATAPVREFICGDDDPSCPERAELVYGPLGFATCVLKGAGHLDLDAGFGPWPAVERWASGTRRRCSTPFPVRSRR